MFFSFVSGRGFNLPTSCTVLCLEEEELHVVQGNHLLGLQIYAGSFETGLQGEMACCSFQGRHLLGLGSSQRAVGSLSMG
jgi:hypothetical protein